MGSSPSSQSVADGSVGEASKFSLEVLKQSNRLFWTRMGLYGLDSHLECCTALHYAFDRESKQTQQHAAEVHQQYLCAAYGRFFNAERLGSPMIFDFPHYHDDHRCFLYFTNRSPAGDAEAVDELLYCYACNPFPKDLERFRPANNTDFDDNAVLMRRCVHTVHAYMISRFSSGNLGTFQPIQNWPTSMQGFNEEAERIARLLHQRRMGLRTGAPPMGLREPVLTLQPASLSNREGLRVLVLDGGGVPGGFAHAEWLKLLECKVRDEYNTHNNLHMTNLRPSNRLADLFDIIVGTSAGGLVALGLTYADLDAARVRDVANEVKRCFTRISPGTAAARALFNTGICNTTALRQVITRNLGARLMVERMPERNDPVCLVIAAERQIPFSTVTEVGFINIPHVRELNRSRDAPEETCKVSCNAFAAVAAVCTSAAPFYFDAYEVTQGTISTGDGGIVANNPVYEAYNLCFLLSGRPPACLVSLGCGQVTPKRNFARTGHNGVDTLFGVFSQKVTATGRTHLRFENEHENPEWYFRFDAELEETVDLAETNDEKLRQYEEAIGRAIRQNSRRCGRERTLDGWMMQVAKLVVRFDDRPGAPDA